MSAYVNDPRVTVQSDGFLVVNEDNVPSHVCPGSFGGFVAHSLDVNDVDGPGYDTPDEAIRSLIGDPQ